MKIILNSVCALLVGVFCRYLFFSVYGYISTILEDNHFFDFYLSILSLPISATILYSYRLFETFIATTISILFPVIFLGYLIGNKVFIYSLLCLLGIFCFDLIYYPIFLSDFSLLFENFKPLWFGILSSLIWFLLFYISFYVGTKLKSLLIIKNQGQENNTPQQ